MYRRTIVDIMSFGRTKVDPLKVGERLSILQGIRELLSILWCISMYEITWKKIVLDSEKFRVWKLQFEILKFGIENLMLRHCHCVVVWSCWNLGHCIIDHVVMLALEHFWSVVSFGHGAIWTMLVAYEILAMLVICDVCWMNFGLNFRSIEIVKFCWHV